MQPNRRIRLVIVSVGVWVVLVGCCSSERVRTAETVPETPTFNAETDTFETPPSTPSIGGIPTQPTAVYEQPYEAGSGSTGVLVQGIDIQPPTDDSDGHVSVTYTNDADGVEQTEQYNFPTTGEGLLLDADSSGLLFRGRLLGTPESREVRVTETESKVWFSSIWGKLKVVGVTILLIGGLYLIKRIVPFV